VHEGKTLLYRASKRDCDVCPLKPQCCPKEPSRKIPRDVHEHARDVARSFAGTEGFEQSRHERKKIEMRFAHLKRHPEARPNSTAWSTLMLTDCVMSGHADDGEPSREVRPLQTGHSIRSARLPTSLSCGMHSALLGGGELGPLDRQLLIAPFFRPAVAARSSSQLREISNVGILSGTATTGMN
jgi:hypothetical protein